jgi:anti-anti-sigma factor
VGTLPFFLDHRNGQTVLCIEGEIDVANVHALEAVLDVLARADSQTVVVDLSDLDFMDIRAAKALLLGAHKIEALGKSFNVTRAPPVLQRILDLLGATMALDPRP